MANVLVNEDSLTGIANAIRGKNGSTDTYKPSEMAEAISAISGGSGPSIPDSAFVLSGSCLYWNAYGKWDLFVTAFKDKWNTTDITNCVSMFNGAKLKSISFQINLKSNSSVALNNMFSDSEFLVLPKINGNNITASSLSNFCSNSKVKNITDDYFTFVSNTNGSCGSIFSNCGFLRNIPTSINTAIQNFNKTSSSMNFYFYMFNNCYTLDEIINLGVAVLPTLNNNCFNSFVTNCWRLDTFTFEANKIVNWKSQTIDFSTVGYGLYANTAKQYDLDIKKLVNSDESYIKLKNDSDWFTPFAQYSRYNHDSAVATINSLPDTSAYLATAGGTNTIKFKSEAGSATDGGAINTLTEEEIAVATAKGWTISLV